jgi:hypothetical protein
MTLIALAGCFQAAHAADEETIALAKRAYRRGKASGADMSRGPCLDAIKPASIPSPRLAAGGHSPIGGLRLRSGG